jgi:hypothetical protein
MMVAMKSNHPAFAEMRLAIGALVGGPGPIRTRLQAAERHFSVVFQSEMRTPAEERLRLRIGAGLVEVGDDEDDSRDVETDASDAEVAQSISLLDEARAVEIAGDMFRLYEILAGLRTDDKWDEQMAGPHSDRRDDNT